MKKPIKINWPSFILSLFIFFLISYTIFDASIAKPNINKKIEHVNEEFDSLKTYLDGKIPEIDNVLVKHQIQIQRQEEQLYKLHKLTESIKGEKN